MHNGTSELATIDTDDCTHHCQHDKDALLEDDMNSTVLKGNLYHFDNPLYIYIYIYIYIYTDWFILSTLQDESCR